MAEDPNKTDFSVHDKDVAALGATHEEQDMTALNRVIVPMPAFTDPEAPEYAAGSVNFALTTHPGEHDAEYGAEVGPGEHETFSPMDGDAGASANRDEWKKDDWKEQAAAYDLPVSGNMDELQARVEEYEAAQEGGDQ